MASDPSLLDLLHHRRIQQRARIPQAPQFILRRLPQDAPLAEGSVARSVQPESGKHIRNYLVRSPIAKIPVNNTT